MARPSLEPAAPSALAPALLRLLRARGVDASLVALGVGLAPEAETRDEEPVAPALLGALLEASAGALGEPFLSLSLPETLAFRRYGAAELSAMASATLREVLARTARYLPLVVPGLEGSLEEDRNSATFRVRPHPGRLHARRHDRLLHEYALAHALTAARRETSLPLRPSLAFFAHPRPPQLGPLYNFFGTHEFSFGAEASGFSLPLDALDAPTRAGDARLLATAVDLAEAALVSSPAARTASSLVADRLRSLLPEASLESVARSLKMSPRTLQRRLEQEDTRFADLLDSVRQSVARALVKDPALPLSEIAFRLGFADLATFSRAFKRWTGLPPGMFRRSLAPAWVDPCGSPVPAPPGWLDPWSSEAHVGHAGHHQATTKPRGRKKTIEASNWRGGRPRGGQAANHPPLRARAFAMSPSFSAASLALLSILSPSSIVDLIDRLLAKTRKRPPPPLTQANDTRESDGADDGDAGSDSNEPDVNDAGDAGDDAGNGADDAGDEGDADGDEGDAGLGQLISLGHIATFASEAPPA